jgi:coenzyme F420-reducing hydrogenase gamma subunit
VASVPISIASDPEQPERLAHAIRAVGRVTRVLATLEAGDRVGLRGPYGRGWPLQAAEGHDLVVLAGGLGCAPVVAAIGYATARRERFGRLVILQGVKHAKDLIWRERYDAWAKLPDTEVRLAADEPDRYWQDIRNRSRWVVPIGACATSGGPQALRNMADTEAWIASVYPEPQHIEALPTADAVAAHVDVELSLPGCPVSTQQVLYSLASLWTGASPIAEQDKVCMDCKRGGQVCVLITQDAPCLGPVTVTGCGALCPAMVRACYGCYGPAENPQVATLAQRFADLGLAADSVARRFMLQQSGAAPFQQAVRDWHQRAQEAAPATRIGAPRAAECTEAEYD